MSTTPSLLPTAQIATKGEAAKPIAERRHPEQSQTASLESSDAQARRTASDFSQVFSRLGQSEATQPDQSRQTNYTAPRDNAQATQGIELAGTGIPDDDPEETGLPESLAAEDAISDFRALHEDTEPAHAPMLRRPLVTNHLSGEHGHSHEFSQSAPDQETAHNPGATTFTPPPKPDEDHAPAVHQSAARTTANPRHEKAAPIETTQTKIPTATNADAIRPAELSPRSTVDGFSVAERTPPALQSQTRLAASLSDRSHAARGFGISSETHAPQATHDPKSARGQYTDSIAKTDTSWPEQGMPGVAVPLQRFDATGHERSLPRPAARATSNGDELAGPKPLQTLQTQHPAPRASHSQISPKTAVSEPTSSPSQLRLRSPAPEIQSSEKPVQPTDPIALRATSTASLEIETHRPMRAEAPSTAAPSHLGTATNSPAVLSAISATPEPITRSAVHVAVIAADTGQTNVTDDRRINMANHATVSANPGQIASNPQNTEQTSQPQADPAIRKLAPQEQDSHTNTVTRDREAFTPPNARPVPQGRLFPHFEAALYDNRTTATLPSSQELPRIGRSEDLQMTARSTDPVAYQPARTPNPQPDGAFTTASDELSFRQTPKVETQNPTTATTTGRFETPNDAEAGIVTTGLQWKGGQLTIAMSRSEHSTSPATPGAPEGTVLAASDNPLHSTASVLPGKKTPSAGQVGADGTMPAAIVAQDSSTQTVRNTNRHPQGYGSEQGEQPGAPDPASSRTTSTSSLVASAPSFGAPASSSQLTYVTERAPLKTERATTIPPDHRSDALQFYDPVARDTDLRIHKQHLPSPSAHSSEHVRAIAAQLAEGATQAQNRAVEIRLNPDELGRVRLSIASGDGGVTVSITAERPDTLDLMRRHIGQLEREFRDIGYDDISFSFGDGSGDSAQGERDENTKQPITGQFATPPESQAGSRQVPSPPQITSSGLDLRL